MHEIPLFDINAFMPKRTNKKLPDKWDLNNFFEDWDLDGVMNGIDCKPLDPKKQDGFITLGQKSPFFNFQNLAPQQCQSIAPSPQVITPPPIIQKNISYTDTNKPFTTDSSGNVIDLNGNKVIPVFRPVVNGTGGGLSTYYRGDLSPNAINAIKSGYNEKAVETMYDLNPLYADKNAKNMVAQAALNYINKQNINLYEPSKPDPRAVLSNGSVQGAYWNPSQNKIYISPDVQKTDRNGLLIHEVVHSIQPSNSPTTTAITAKTINSGGIVNPSTPNITGRNYNAQEIKDFLNNSIYSNITTAEKNKEVEAYYIEQYYDRRQPRNVYVDNFEKKMGINTSRQLTPDENRLYNDAETTLIKQAQDKNDMNTRIFAPMKKLSNFVYMRV